ncbi:MAG TPA: hypothetical protein PKU94_08610 [Candidatus Hydrothermia bacterium]|nr:hypothetical protein [Candidatus Hydrothermia bacterium]
MKQKTIQSHKQLNDLLVRIILNEGPVDYYKVYERLVHGGFLSKSLCVTRKQVYRRLWILEQKGLIKRVGMVKKRTTSGKFREHILYDASL